MVVEAERWSGEASARVRAPSKRTTRERAPSPYAPHTPPFLRGGVCSDSVSDSMDAEPCFCICTGEVVCFIHLALAAEVFVRDSEMTRTLRGDYMEPSGARLST